MARRFLSLALLALTLHALGCASTRAGRGGADANESGGPRPGEASDREATSSRDASERMVAQAQARLARKPGDPAAMRDLGIGLYRLGRFDEGLEALKTARESRPGDRRALLFQARCLDTLGRTPKALEAYGEFLARARGRDAQTVRARMEQLRRLLIREEVTHAIARESELRAVEIPEGTVAVPDFANPAESDTLRALAKGLAVIVTTDLAQVRQIRVVERRRISTLLAELKLTQESAVRDRSAEGPEAVTTVRGQKQRLAALTDASTGKPYYSGEIDDRTGDPFVQAVRAFQSAHGLAVDGQIGPRTRAALEEAWDRLPPQDKQIGASAVAVFDPRTVPRMGRLLGARTIVQGSVLPVGPDLQLRADLVPVGGDGAPASTEPVEGKRKEFLDLEKRLVDSILDALGVEPTREERRRIGRKVTANWDACLAYCRGLDLEDQGRLDEAVRSYRRALELDPGFRLAADAAAALTTGAGDLGALETATAPPSAPSASAPEAATRAASTAGHVGMLPLIEVGPQVDIVTPDPTRPTEETGRIVVIGAIPGSNGGRP